MKTILFVALLTTGVFANDCEQVIKNASLKVQNFYHFINNYNVEATKASCDTSIQLVKNINCNAENESLSINTYFGFFDTKLGDPSGYIRGVSLYASVSRDNPKGSIYMSGCGTFCMDTLKNLEVSIDSLKFDYETSAGYFPPKKSLGKAEFYKNSEGELTKFKYKFKKSGLFKSWKKYSCSLD